MLLISQMSSSFSLTIFLSDAWLIAVLHFWFFLAKAGAKSYFSAQKWIVQGGRGGGGVLPYVSSIGMCRPKE